MALLSLSGETRLQRMRLHLPVESIITDLLQAHQQAEFDVIHEIGCHGTRPPSGKRATRSVAKNDEIGSNFAGNASYLLCGITAA